MKSSASFPGYVQGLTYKALLITWACKCYAKRNHCSTVSRWSLLWGIVCIFSGWDAAHRCGPYVECLCARHGTKLPNNQWKRNKSCQCVIRELARWPNLAVYSTCSQNIWICSLKRRGVWCLGYLTDIWTIKNVKLKKKKRLGREWAAK